MQALLARKPWPLLRRQNWFGARRSSLDEQQRREECGHVINRSGLTVKGLKTVQRCACGDHKGATAAKACDAGQLLNAENTHAGEIKFRVSSALTVYSYQRKL